MAENTTRLGLLMNTLHISGRALANAVHVDYSLVSKWKNGHRPLPQDAELLSAMAGYCLQAEQDSGGWAVREMLHTWDPSVDCTNAKAMEAALIRWLKETPPATQISRAAALAQTPDSLYRQIPVILFDGLKGYSEALRQMKTCLDSLPAGQELLILCQEGASSLTLPQEISAALAQFFTQALHAGHFIHSICHLNSPYPQSLCGSLSALQSTFGAEHVSISLLPPAPQNSACSLIFILRQHLALSCIRIPQNDLYYCALYTDAATIHALTGLWECYHSSASTPSGAP